MGAQEQKKSKLNVFVYDDYRKFLAAFYEQKKQEMPNKFSYRYFSQKAGFSSSTYFHRVIIGKRNLSLESVRKVCKFIELKGRPSEYFEKLVLFNQAKKEEDKIKYFEELKEFKEYIQERLIRKDQMLYFSKWYFPVIREMVKWQDFEPRHEWIARKISPRISLAQAKEAMHVLHELGLIKTDKKGNCIQSDPMIKTEEQALGKEAVLYHKQAMKLALHSLNIPSHDRNLNSMTFSLTPAHFEIIRCMMDKFQKEITGIITKKVDKKLLNEFNIPEHFNDPKNTKFTNVCQLNMQMFKLAKSKGHYE